MEQVKAEEFLQPKAMLTPGIAGGVTMLIANALWVAFSLPPRWTSLALSFLLGLLVFVATTRVPVWQRAVYYLLNSLIIFSVSIGTNYVGVGVTRPPTPQTNVGGPTGPAGTRVFFGDWLQLRAVGEHAPSGPPLQSAVFPADTGRVRATDAGVFRALVDTVTSNLSRLEIHVTTLAPGKAPHPPHRHAHEELMIVRTGTLEVLQNVATRRAGPGAVIFEASNELHGLRNPGPDSATYVVIRIDPHDLPIPGSHDHYQD
jgi:quercetin dioxygenase-like cupin family protein